MNSADDSAKSQISAKNSSRRPRIRPGRERPSSPTITVSRASSGNSTTTATAMTTASGASTSLRTSLGGSMAGASVLDGPGLTSVQRGEIGRGRGVRPLDTYLDHSLVAIAKLRQIWRPSFSAGRQHVHIHVVGQCRHLLVESVPAGNLESDQADLPRAAGWRQRTLDPAGVQDVDTAGAKSDGTPDRDGIDEPAVEVMLAVDLDRRQQPRNGAGGQHSGHDRPAAEPARAGALDTGRDAVKGQLKVGEVVRRQHLGQRAAQWLDRVQMRA